ncbi:hypothetical protein OROHE_004585 [Orobanche hederae]
MRPVQSKKEGSGGDPKAAMARDGSDSGEFQDEI